MADSTNKPSAEAQLALLRNLLLSDERTRTEARMEEVIEQCMAANAKVVRELRSDIQMLEQHVSGQISRLEQIISQEQQARIDGNRALRDHIERCVDHFEGCVQAVRGAITHSEKGLRSQMKEFAEAVKEGADKEVRETKLIVERTREEVQKSQMDRSIVATMLNDVAEKIRS